MAEIMETDVSEDGEEDCDENDVNKDPSVSEQQAEADVDDDSPVRTVDLSSPEVHISRAPITMADV